MPQTLYVDAPILQQDSGFGPHQHDQIGRMPELFRLLSLGVCPSLSLSFEGKGLHSF